MCGLVFTTGTHGPGSPGWERAMRVLECRGPDSHDELRTTGYSAGQRRLEIIGLGEPGHQPCTTDPSADVLVFNGEIYNYREIGQSYGIVADSDTQVLYQMLHRGLEGRLSELRGMFAFVYWRREPESIIAARDYFGVKPLFVAHGADGSLSFASVAAALASLTGERAPDPESIAGFLATGYFPSATSPYRGIEKCPEGQVTTWRRRGGQWAASVAPLTLDGWPDMPTADAVADSVRAHLVSDVPVGVLLSGGLDSTLLAATAARQVDGLRTYSLTNPGAPSIDEAAYARWNAAAIGATHTEVPFDPRVALSTVKALVASSGEPFGDPACIPLATLCQRVAEDVKVVLAGEGADELFGGYRRYQAERLRDRPALRGPLRLAGRIMRGPARYQSERPTQRVRTWASWAESDDLLAHSLLLSAEWQAVGAAMPLASARAIARHQATWTDLAASQRGLGLPSHRAYDLTQWLPNVFLEKSDRASMLHSVEVRVPYLDGVVARSSMTHAATGTDKRPLRQALDRILPSARIPSRKMGLSVDLTRLIGDGGLAAYVDFALHDPQSLVRTEHPLDLDLLVRRAQLNPALSFRLATLAVWQQHVAA